MEVTLGREHVEVKLESKDSRGILEKVNSYIGWKYELQRWNVENGFGESSGSDWGWSRGEVEFILSYEQNEESNKAFWAKEICRVILYYKIYLVKLYEVN